MSPVHPLVPGGEHAALRTPAAEPLDVQGSPKPV
jgi:hypothetical protein